MIAHCPTESPRTVPAVEGVGPIEETEPETFSEAPRASVSLDQGKDVFAALPAMVAWRKNLGGKPAETGTTAMFPDESLTARTQFPLLPCVIAYIVGITSATVAH